MKYRSAIALFPALFLAIPGMANDTVPPELVGIWASEGSVLNDRHALFEGQGIYLRADRRGMMIGGPPPIGVLFISRYDEKKKVLTFRVEGPGKCVDGEAAYDPKAKTLDGGVKLRRRVAGMPAYWAQSRPMFLVTRSR
jgi:hypothetical protein